jgi:hypothetical protein
MNFELLSIQLIKRIMKLLIEINKALVINMIDKSKKDNELYHETLDRLMSECSLMMEISVKGIIMLLKRESVFIEAYLTRKKTITKDVYEAIISAVLQYGSSDLIYAIIRKIERVPEDSLILIKQSTRIHGDDIRLILTALAKRGASTSPSRSTPMRMIFDEDISIYNNTMTSMLTQSPTLSFSSFSTDTPMRPRLPFD